MPVSLRPFAWFLARIALVLVAGLLPGSPHRVVVDSALESAPPELGESVATLRVEALPRERAAGGRVRIFAINESRAYFVSDVKLDAKAEVFVSGLTVGAHWVVVDAPGLARSATMILLDRSARVLSVALDPERTLDVTVLRDDETPLVEAEVEVGGSGPVPVGAKTDATGRVHVVGLGKPPWQVRARATGYESTTRRVDGESESVRIVLHRLGSLTVRVVEGDMRPTPNATVWIASPVLGGVRTTQTGLDGSAVVSSLQPGTYSLRAQKDGQVSSTEVGVGVALGVASSVTLRLALGRMLPVRVIDAIETARGVGGAGVVVTEEGLSPFPIVGAADPNGRITLGPFLRDEALSVRVLATGYVAFGPMHVPPGATEEALVHLQKAATIEGRVVDARGFPVDGASLEILGTDVYGGPLDETLSQLRYREASLPGLSQSPAALIPAGELGVMPGPLPSIPRGPSASFLPGASTPQVGSQAASAKIAWVSRKDGTFVLEPVAAGEIVVLARQPQFTEALSEPITVKPGGRAEVRIVMRRGGSIEGRVVDERTMPVAGATIRLIAWHGDRERMAKSGTDGTFAFAAVPERVTLLVGTPDDPLSTVVRLDVNVLEDRRREIEIVLPKQRESLPVRARDRRGFPIDAVQVTAISVSAQSALRRTVFTDARGEAQLAGARGLPLRIEARAPHKAPVFLDLDATASAVELTLFEGERVTGDVRDARGFPLAQASVSLRGPHETRHALTGRDGTFAIGEVGEGDAHIRVRAKGFASREVRVRLQKRLGEGSTDAGRIELREEGVVRGRVVDVKGEPVSGARVAVGTAPTFVPVGRAADEDRSVAVSDARGEFELRELAEGLIDIEAYAAGHGRGKATSIDVRAGKTTTDVRIDLVKEDEGAKGAIHLPGSVAVTLGESSATSEVVIARVAEGSEAARAGLAPGDVLVEVDGVATHSIADARSRLDGPIGIDVVVRLKRASEDRRVRIKRERVRR